MVHRYLIKEEIMLDEYGNRIMQVFYCPKCEKDKGYISKGTIFGKCLKCGSIINYTFEKIEDKNGKKIT